ncbi:MAG TPA: hypothetical protein VF483_06375 [Gemmatimonadaceae bacterium]
MHHSASPQSRRFAFTLVEVTVALVVAAVVVQTLRLTFEIAIAAGGEVTRQAQSSEAVRNGELELRDVVGQIIAPSSPSNVFDGVSGSAAFSSRCAVPSGWFEECRATLSVQQRGDSSDVVLAEPGAAFIVLRRQGLVELRYLVATPSRDEWVSSWKSVSAAPLAIAVQSSNGTLILRLGDRG